MVSVLHKELEYKVEKLNRSCSRGSKTCLSFQLVNKARLIRGRGLNRGFMVTRIEQLVPKYSLTGGFLRRLKTNMKHCETSLYIPNWNFFGWVCGTGAELSALCAAPCVLYFWKKSVLQNWLKLISDSEDDYRTGCRNVNHCQQKQQSNNSDDQTQPKWLLGSNLSQRNSWPGRDLD